MELKMETRARMFDLTLIKIKHQSIVLILTSSFLPQPGSPLKGDCLSWAGIETAQFVDCWCILQPLFFSTTRYLGPPKSLFREEWVTQERFKSSSTGWSPHDPSVYFYFWIILFWFWSLPCLPIPQNIPLFSLLGAVHYRTFWTRSHNLPLLHLGCSLTQHTSRKTATERKLLFICIHFMYC